MACDVRFLVSGRTIERLRLSNGILFESNFNLSAINLGKFENTSIYESDFEDSSFAKTAFDHSGVADCKFMNAIFCSTDIVHVKFTGCDFRKCQFDGARFYKVRFRYCIFDGASFRDCNFLDCSFEGCFTAFDEVRNCSGFPYVPMACPEEGEFIGYKKVCLNLVEDKKARLCSGIVKLRIPADAKRSSAGGRKCRCSHAYVEGVYTLRGEPVPKAVVGYSAYRTSGQITYVPGKMAYADKWDDDRWNTCSNGIHFFLNRMEAVNY